MHKQYRFCTLSLHTIMPESHGWPNFINMHEDMQGACHDSACLCLQLTGDVPAAGRQGEPGLALELVLPGLTVPWAHAVYLWVATALSLAVHEVR